MAAAAAEGEQQTYVTAGLIGSAWRALRAGPRRRGRWRRARLNVLVNTDDAGGLVLQVVDPILGLQDQACSVVEQERMSTEPCSTNPAGECDVARS